MKILKDANCVQGHVFKNLQKARWI